MNAAFLRAVELHRRGMFAASEASCRECLAGDPFHSGDLRLLAVIANTSGDGREAAELLARAIRAAPRDVAARVDLGHTLFGLGRIEEAVTALSCAVSIDPSHVQAQTSLGGALAHLGRTAEAEATLGKALELDAGAGPSRSVLSRC